MPSVPLLRIHIPVLLVNLARNSRPTTTTHLGQRLPKLRLPLVEVLEELCSLRVAGSALVQTLSTPLLQEGVDEFWHPLIGPRPVAIATSEDRVLDALGLFAL